VRQGGPVSRNWPPSENESGVTFTMPITSAGRGKANLNLQALKTMDGGTSPTIGPGGSTGQTLIPTSEIWNPPKTRSNSDFSRAPGSRQDAAMHPRPELLLFRTLFCLASSSVLAAAPASGTMTPATGPWLESGGFSLTLMKGVWPGPGCAVIALRPRYQAPRDDGPGRSRLRVGSCHDDLRRGRSSG